MLPYPQLDFKLLKARGYPLRPLWSICYHEKNHRFESCPEDLGLDIHYGAISHPWQVST